MFPHQLHFPPLSNWNETSVQCTYIYRSLYKRIEDLLFSHTLESTKTNFIACDWHIQLNSEGLLYLAFSKVSYIDGYADTYLYRAEAVFCNVLQTLSYTFLWDTMVWLVTLVACTESLNSFNIIANTFLFS